MTIYIIDAIIKCVPGYSTFQVNGKNADFWCDHIDSGVFFAGFHVHQTFDVYVRTHACTHTHITATDFNYKFKFVSIESAGLRRTRLSNGVLKLILYFSLFFLPIVHCSSKNKKRNSNNTLHPLIFVFPFNFLFTNALCFDCSVSHLIYQFIINLISIDSLESANNQKEKKIKFC